MQDQQLVDQIRIKLAAVAQELLQDYQSDAELTIFTALDSEDFLSFEQDLQDYEPGR
jgi:hypothetical protein